MRKNEHGFSGIEALLIVLVLVMIGGVAFNLYRRNHQVDSTVATPAVTTAKTSKTAAIPAATNGSTASIANLTSLDASSESSIDAKYSSGDQSTAAVANSAAAGIGGAYDESSL